MSYHFNDGVHVIVKKRTDGDLMIMKKRTNGELDKHIEYKNKSDKVKTIHFYFPGTNGRYEDPILFHVDKGKNEAVIEPDFEDYAHIIKVKFAPNQEKKINLTVRNDEDNEIFDRRYSNIKNGKKKEGFWKKLWRFIKNPCKYCRDKIERERIKKIFKENIESRKLIEEMLLYVHGIIIKPDTVSNGDIVQDKKVELLNKLHTKISDIRDLLNNALNPRDKSEKFKEITQPSSGGGRRKTKK